MTSATFLLSFGGTLIFFVLLWALFAQFLPHERVEEREKYAENWDWPER